MQNAVLNGRVGRQSEEHFLVSAHDFRPDLQDVRSKAQATIDSIDNALAVNALGGLLLPETARPEDKPSLVEALPHEAAVRAQLHSFLGRTAVKHALQESAQSVEIIASKHTLAKSVEAAKRGDKEAEARVDINVATAASEALFKTEHFTQVKKIRSADGSIIQFGQTLDKVNEDAILCRPHRDQRLKQFTLAELVNGYREQALVDNEELQDAWLVTASCVPENLPEELLDHRGDGFFTLSMTYSLQGTTQEGADIITQSIFNRGTTTEETASYAERQAGRFDLAALGKVYERFGLEAPKTALEMLQRPLKIPKTLMPNGMIDFWRWVDVAADEIAGRQIVRTVDEYVARKEKSRQREAGLSQFKQEVKEALLASTPFESDLHAVDTLWELVRTNGVVESIKNIHIDPLVFGVKASHAITAARKRSDDGDVLDALRWMAKAVEAATVSGCGGGSCGLIDVDPASPEGASLRDKLEFKEGDSFIKDEERSCANCYRKGGVFYVVGLAKENKGCEHCGVVEIRNKKS